MHGVTSSSCNAVLLTRGTMDDGPTRISQIYREGVALIVRLVHPRKWQFVGGALGATMFALAIIASAEIVGWTTGRGDHPRPRRRADRLVVADDRAVDHRRHRAVEGHRDHHPPSIRPDSCHSGRASIFGAQLLAHQLKLDMPWFSRQATGDLLSVSEVDSGQATFILGPLPFGTGAIVLLVAASITMLLTESLAGTGRGRTESS